MNVFSIEQAAPISVWLQSHTPLVNCLTNNVSKNFVANALLAVGASPSMVEAPEEVAALTPLADATVINLGSLTRERMPGILTAAAAAQERGRIWLLDPAAVSDSLRLRSDFARELLAFAPSIIRGNAAEILYLAGERGSSRGADSLSASDEAVGAAAALAAQLHCVVVVSGKTDYISDGRQSYAVSGGHAQMARVTGTGCALSAIVAACACAASDRLPAATAACMMMKQAGEYAAAHSSGLGSFAAALLDGLTITKRG